MTSDDFLDALKDDWKSQPPRASATRQAVERRERQLRRWKWQNLASAIGVGALATLFAGLAWRTGDVLQLVGALAFAATLPIMLAGYFDLRREERADYLGDARAVLERSVGQARIALRHLGASLLAALLLGASALAALGLALVGEVTMERALAIAAVWGATAAGVLLWQRQRRTRLEAELAHFEAMLDALGLEAEE